MQNKIVDFAIFTHDEFIEWQKAEKRYLSTIQLYNHWRKNDGRWFSYLC